MCYTTVVFLSSPSTHNGFTEVVWDIAVCLFLRTETMGIGQAVG